MLTLRVSQFGSACRCILPAAALLIFPAFAADNPHTLTVMSRNMDAGTDMNYVLAATDAESLVRGTFLTLGEVKASGIPDRAARLADEIAAARPDVIALQEVTLWRTGALLTPPATDVLYDQLDLLMKELAKRKLHYGIVAVQSLLDAEAPVPLIPPTGLDLRITDRNVMLARTDLPPSQFRVTDVRAGDYSVFFHFGSPLLGEFVEPAGWMSADVEIFKTKVRVVNTHLETAGVPYGAQIQLAQAAELLALVADPTIQVVLAGDFNANAEPGPEHTGTVEQIVAAGYTDCWTAQHAGAPGFTWPLFGEDQMSGPTLPNERIDLVFLGPAVKGKSGKPAELLSETQTGAAAPYASDHAGVVASFRISN
jgi:endonuclease/exonuclease/phosphatase family metal-dependent hydrolase